MNSELAERPMHKNSTFGRIENFSSRLAHYWRKLPRRFGSEIRLEAILAAMADAVVVADKSGALVDLNEAFARLHRFNSKAECRRALHEYWAILEVATLEGQPLPAEEWPLARALRGESARSIELKVTRRDTQESWFAVYNYAPIRTEDGSMVGAVFTARDITEARQTQDRLTNISSRLHLALSSAHLGVWEWNIITNELSWDDRMFELYGTNRELFSTVVGSWEKALHPDDRDPTVALLHAAVRGEKEFDTAFRVIYQNGDVRYLKANGIVLRGADGSAQRMLGVNADITDEKLASNRLQVAYAQVEAKVVERTAQLEAAKLAAEGANRAKDLFLATLSHELRSPLSAILSWTQLMERGMLPPEKMSVGIRTIKESVWAQNQLIGDLLDLSRISTGKLSMDRQPTEVVEVLKAAIEAIRPSAEQRGLVIEERFEDCDIYISADPARLKQSFWNLLSNAVKFTPAEGRITITVQCREIADEHKVQVAITDTGKGIKPEFIPHLFERFSQADASSVRVHGGMGLGLSLVKSLTELQDGSVSAESGGEGQGATFTLTFPLLRGFVPRPEEEITTTAQAHLVNGAHLRDLKVLLVEDGDKTRIALAQLLASQGANVRAEASAREALNAFKTFRPDVVVSDIAMPEEDGHSLMRELRQLDAKDGGETPAVALTAYAEPRDREAAFSSGFQEYLNKPVDIRILSDAIVKLTGHRTSIS
jgi:signal transduction histidine kinase/ActR/RegA family two-component response regulator